MKIRSITLGKVILSEATAYLRSISMTAERLIPISSASFPALFQASSDRERFLLLALIIRNIYSNKTTKARVIILVGLRLVCLLFMTKTNPIKTTSGISHAPLTRYAAHPSPGERITAERGARQGALLPGREGRRRTSTSREACERHTERRLWHTTGGGERHGKPRVLQSESRQHEHL